MSRNSGQRAASTEGPWTRAGVIAGMLALVLAYLGLAIPNHWLPFQSSNKDARAATASPSFSSAPPSSPVVSPQRPQGGTAPVNPYEPGQQAVLLSDPMTSVPGKWANESAGTGTCSIQRDGLHAAANGQSVYHECYSGTSVTDFTFEVTFVFGSSSGAGVFFRESGRGSWYNAQFSKDGIALISKADAGTSTNLKSRQLSRPDPDVRHTLAVVAVGDMIVFYVDHQRAVTVTDDSYSSGLVGVYTVNAQPGGEATFRDAVVWGP